MKKIFISTSSFAQFSKEPLDLLKRNNFDVTINPYGRKLTKQESIEVYSKYDGIIAGTEIFDEEVLKISKKLKIISRVGVGLDNIDLNYAMKNNIVIKKSDTRPSLAVSELVVGLILDLSRKISSQNNQMKNGKWNKKMGVLLSGKTLGVLGLGHIGKTLVNLTKGFGLKYLATDIHKDEKFAKINNVKYCELEYLLEKSDIISIHLSLGENNKKIISDEEFKIMKNDVILINTSRGEVLDEDALYRVLGEGKLGGVGLDVYEEEPYSGALKDFNNVILTPHIASYAKEIRIAMEVESTKYIVEALKT